MAMTEAEKAVHWFERAFAIAEERDRYREAMEVAIDQLTHRIDHERSQGEDNCPRCVALSALTNALSRTENS